MHKLMQMGRVRWRLLLLAVVTAASLCLPAMAWGAQGDPTLRFDLTTDSPQTGLSAGDQVLVNVEISREDGSTEPFHLYSIMLDIEYDNQLLEVSQMKTIGLKRPDGTSWIGEWSCNTVPGEEDSKQVRILYLNIGGLMSSPPRLDSISGSLTAASFLLTVKQDVADVSSAVKFYFTESCGSDYKKGPSVIGNELTLKLEGSSNSGGGSDSGNSSGGSGNASGSGGSNSGSSSGGSGAGNASGSGGSDSGTDSGAGTPGQGGQSGAALPPAVSFDELTDIDDTHWAAPYVRYLVEKGILSGNEKKEFQPEKSVTRAEFAQMIVSAFGYPEKSSEKSFSDVGLQDWYYQPVMALYEAGVVSGMDDGSFGADESLTRQDMAVIIDKVMQDQNLFLPSIREYEEFQDETSVADYAQKALRQLYCTGIVSGTGAGELAPEAPSTRAQAATVLTNIRKKVEEGR